MNLLQYFFAHFFQVQTKDSESNLGLSIAMSKGLAGALSNLLAASCLFTRH